MIKLKSILLESITDTPEFKRWFGNSKVVDGDGNPLIMYHATPKAGFNVFRSKSHFGTFNQANNKTIEGFYYDASGLPVRNQKVAIYPVYLKIENPKRIKDVLDNWDLEIEKAKKEKYDGIVYENEYEGVGDSWVVFKSNQVKSAIGNNGQFNLNNTDITK